MLALKIAVFLLALSLGIFASALGRIEVREDPEAQPVAVDHTCHPPAGETGHSRCWKQAPRIGGRSGSSSGFDRSDRNVANRPPLKITKPLKVTYKQKAQYTAEARTNGLQGIVKLRVTFLASGKIGSITTIQGLPYGLTEQAIEAARKMRFEPEAVAEGKRTTTRPVTFTFNIY